MLRKSRNHFSISSILRVLSVCPCIVHNICVLGTVFRLSLLKLEGNIGISICIWLSVTHLFPALFSDLVHNILMRLERYVYVLGVQIIMPPRMEFWVSGFFLSVCLSVTLGQKNFNLGHNF